MAEHRILIIGTGSIGERHLRCLLATGRAAVGMVEINDDLRGEIAQRYNVKEVFASLDEALGGKWDAGVVATPAPSHIPIALRLAEAGVCMLIEKPLSTATDGVEELMEKVESRGLVAAVAYVYRAHPSLAGMREALRSGRFGKPVQLVAVSGHNFAFYRPAYREIYYTDRTRGGGAIQDALTHIFNASEWLVGPIDRLCADAAHMVLDGVEVEDTVHVLTRHGEAMGCFSLNQHQAPNEIIITVVCEKGTLRLETCKHRWRWMDSPNGQWHDEVADIKGRDDWFIIQEQAFLDVLEGTAKPLCTLEEGLQTLKVNLAALSSADERSGWKTIT